MKNNCCLFERLFRVKKNGVFLFGISFSFWRYLRFCILSDDVIGGSLKTARHSIENNSRNMKAVFFKLGTSDVRHKRSRLTPTMLLPWQHSWFQSLSVKKLNIPICNLLKWARGSCSEHTWFPYFLNSPH